MLEGIRSKLLQLDALSASIVNVECWEPGRKPVEQQIDGLVEEIEAACPGFECVKTDTAFTAYQAQLRYALVPVKEQGT